MKQEVTKAQGKTMIVSFLGLLLKGLAESLMRKILTIWWRVSASGRRHKREASGKDR